MRGPFERVTHQALVVMELAIMSLLAVLVVLAIAGLIVKLVPAFVAPFLSGAELARVLDDLLAVFVLVELLATAAAYVRGTDVLRHMLEAVFVALSRKVIMLELGPSALVKASALAVLFAAAAFAWWLISRIGYGTAPREDRT